MTSMPINERPLIKQILEAEALILQLRVSQSYSQVLHVLEMNLKTKYNAYFHHFYCYKFERKDLKH